MIEPLRLNPTTRFCFLCVYLYLFAPLCASLCVCPPLPPQVISMIKSSALCGSAIIAYLQAKGYPEVRLAGGGGQRGGELFVGFAGGYRLPWVA